MVRVKLTGHYNYYGISGNLDEMKRYYQKTKERIFHWFSNKSQRNRWSREEFEIYLTRYPLPLPKLTYEIYHTW